MSEPREKRDAPPPQRGDEDALYRRYDHRLRGIVRSRVNTSDATIDDACSYAWLQLLRYQPERARLLGWLAVTATREAIALDQRARRTVPLVTRDSFKGEDFEFEPASPRDEMAEAIEYRSALSDVAAADLTDRQKRAVGLLAGGYSYTNISEITGWSVRTVERQILRAREKLVVARDLGSRHPERRSLSRFHSPHQRSGFEIDL